MSDPKTKGTTQGEPSMEEILASIRRIISEDGDPAKSVAPPTAPAAAPAPAPVPAAPEPPPAPRVAAPPPPPPAPPKAPEPVIDDVLELTEVVEEELAPPPAPGPSLVAEDDALLSSSAVSAASGSLASLLSAKRQTERSMVNNPMPLGNAGLTIEAIVREELRPILKAWLDQNLTPMVERMVQREIERIASKLD